MNDSVNKEKNGWPVKFKANAKIKNITVYLLSIVLSLVFFILVTRLWKADLSIPLAYNGDVMFASANIKSIIDNGWYTQNNKVGLPYGTNMYDYPTSDNLFYLIMKIISLFTSDWALTLNIFFILTFPLSALTATFVFRKFNIDPLLSK